MDTVRRYSMLIDGDWVDADDRFEIRSPATEELVASVAKGGREHADRAIAAAKAVHADGRWRRTPPQQRAAVLDAIADKLTEQINDLAVLEALENGSPVRQAAAFQIGFSIAHLRYFADLARSYAFERTGPLLHAPTLASGIIRREPIGVCAAIVPWNFPLLLAMWKIGPALAAGNTLVIKPDEHTPLTLLEFARIAQECGLPPGVLNVVPGEGHVVGARLASHPDVRKIAFTGSTAVGREIMRMAAGNVKRLTLELGGKGPNIVLDDADLDLAADGTLFGCLMNAGQACESGTRIIVADAIHDKFVERLVERARTISVGDPLDPATDLGPVISAEARDRILRYIDTGVKEGATLAYGGGRAAGPRFERGFWVEPTIFSDVRNDMTIAREEIFGPVLSVIRAESTEAAVQIANDTEYGLSAGVWSTDNQRALDVAGQIEAGTVWVNDWHMVNAAYPFGGYKQSGLGRELGPHALDEYTEEKFVHLDLSGRLDRRAYALLLGTPPA
jgi:betaine-aldehyde dehydrogenase